MVKSLILCNLLVKVHVNSKKNPSLKMLLRLQVLGDLSEKTEKQWTAAYLRQSPAAHSACQLPSNDLEAMSASLSAITTANGKWVGEGR